MQTFKTIFDVREYGAIPDGKELCSAAIQTAIDDCSANGGGTVLIAQGIYLAGTIQLKTGVTLHLDRSAILLGSPNIHDYYDDGSTRDDDTNIYRTPVLCSYPPQALIYAIDAQNIAIVGGGIIDGQGEYDKYFPNIDDPKKDRPSGITLINCMNITIQDVTLKSTAFWSTRFMMCKEMNITGVRIHTLKSGNGDGLDFIGGENVSISNCILEAGDDCISLKSFEPEHIIRHFTITNCVMTSTWAAIRFGVEANGNMQDIVVNNCIFDCCGDGLKIQNTGGSIFENMIFSNITMRNVERPFFVTLNTFNFSRNPPCRPCPGVMRNLVFKDISATVSHNKDWEEIIEDKIQGACISGTLDSKIENITFENITLHQQGGEIDPALAYTDVPEFLDYTGLYPESRNFKRKCGPASFYIRHVKNSFFRNIRVSVEQPDIRPMILLDDVKDCQFFSVFGVCNELTPTMILTSDCVENDFDNIKLMENKNIPTIAEVDGEEVQKYKNSKIVARELDAMYEKEAKLTDIARSAKMFLDIENWEQTGEQGHYTYIAEVKIKDKSFENAYLHFGWLYGNIQVYINGKEVAIRNVPNEYKSSFFWTVDISSHINIGDNEIKAVLSGGQALVGIHKPVKICFI
jgi:hypothetical protein